MNSVMDDPNSEVGQSRGPEAPPYSADVRCQAEHGAHRQVGKGNQAPDISTPKIRPSPRGSQLSALDTPYRRSACHRNNAPA